MAACMMCETEEHGAERHTADRCRMVLVNKLRKERTVHVKTAHELAKERDLVRRLGKTLGVMLVSFECPVDCDYSGGECVKRNASAILAEVDKMREGT